MKFTPINCWIIQTEVFDINTLKERLHDIQIIKKSILKNGYRAFFIEDKEKVEQSAWYKDFLLTNEIRIYIDGSGVYKIANIDLSDNEIYFERLNVPVGYKPWIFYSWQSDYNSSRSNIQDALAEIVDEINKTRNPRQPLELVLSTRSEDGAFNIVDSIKKNIDQSLLIIADITNVSQVKKLENIDNEQDVVEVKIKCYPNANVVFELSYAFIRKNSSQIILAKKKRTDFKNTDGSVSDEVPFDFAQNLNLPYDKPSVLKDKLREIIVKYLQRITFIS